MIPDIVCISFVIFSLFLEANKLFSFSSFFWNVETLCLSKSIFIHFTDQLVWVMGFQYLDCVHFYMFYFNYFLDSFFSFSFLSFWNYYFGMFDFPVSPLDFLYSLCYLMFFLASFSSLYNQPFLKNFSFKSHIFSFKSSFFCTVPFFVCFFGLFLFHVFKAEWARKADSSGQKSCAVAILPKMSPYLTWYSHPCVMQSSWVWDDLVTCF